MNSTVISNPMALLRAPSTLEKTPDLQLAQWKHLLQLPELSAKHDRVEIAGKIVEAIKKEDLAPFYEELIRDVNNPLVGRLSEETLATMKHRNVQKLQEFDTFIEDAEKNLTAKEVRENNLKKAEYLCRIGNKDEALAALRETYDKTGALAQKVEILFNQIRIGLFYMDRDVIRRSIDEAKILIEEGGDWDRRNRLKVYQGMYAMSIGDFKAAADHFLETISTFTSHELIERADFVKYTVIVSMFALPRKDLKEKVIKGAEIQEVLDSQPALKAIVMSLCGREYEDFFKRLAELETELKEDRLLSPHSGYYVREMRLKYEKKTMQEECHAMLNDKLRNDDNPFNSHALKTNLDLAANKLKLLEKKKTELNLKARKEIADYIQDGKVERANVAVLRVIREDYTVEAMEIVEMYCDLLLARFGLVEQMKELDEGLAEAVSSLIWIAPRLQTDVAELKLIGDQLTAKYGKPYGLACRENAVGTVSQKLMQKTSVQAPPKILVERYLIEISKNYNVDYDPDQRVFREADEELLIDVGEDDHTTNNLDGEAPGSGGGGARAVQPLYPCVVCDPTGNKKFECLTDHYTTFHMGNGQCDLCSASFRISRSLNGHYHFEHAECFGKLQPTQEIPNYKIDDFYGKDYIKQRIEELKIKLHGKVYFEDAYVACYNEDELVPFYTVEFLRNRSVVVKREGLDESYRHDEGLSPFQIREPHVKHLHLQLGHMAAAQNHAYAKEAHKSTFTMWNLYPTTQSFNSRLGGFEAYTRSLTLCWNEVVVVTGVIYNRDETHQKAYGVQVKVPSHVFKILYLVRGEQTELLAFLFAHESLAENTPSMYSCRTTLAGIEEKAGLQIFEENVAELSWNVKRGTIFRCRHGKCQAAFEDEGQLKTHLSNHGTFVCKTCPKTFPTEEGRKLHMERSHMKYICSFSGCGREFWDKGKLKRHTYTHSEAAFECETCHTKYKNKCDLQAHMDKGHPSLRPPTWEYLARPFVCQHEGCSKRFKQRSGLTVHAAVHSEEKPFACATCTVKYKLKTSLRKHQRKTGHVSPSKRPQPQRAKKRKASESDKENRSDSDDDFVTTRRKT